MTLRQKARFVDGTSASHFICKSEESNFALSICDWLFFDEDGLWDEAVDALADVDDLGDAAVSDDRSK
jgi:hypothetical protein